MIKYGYKGLSKIRRKIQSKELKEKWRKSIYIMDRNYVSFDFLVFLQKSDIKFLSRLNLGLDAGIFISSFV